MRRIASATIMTVFLSLPASGLQDPPNPPSAQVPGQARNTRPEPDKGYVIGLEDVLSVFVWREPDLSIKDIVVRPDGKITLPLINDIQAAGLTADQLQEQITEKLKVYLESPQVTVLVSKVMSQKVSVMGEVGSPGVYPLTSPMTVLELLAKAGGFKEYAKKKDIRIVRKEGGREITFKFNYKEVAAGKKLSQNITLKNGDIVIVP